MQRVFLNYSILINPSCSKYLKIHMPVKMLQMKLMKGKIPNIFSLTHLFIFILTQKYSQKRKEIFYGVLKWEYPTSLIIRKLLGIPPIIFKHNHTGNFMYVAIQTPIRHLKIAVHRNLII